MPNPNDPISRVWAMFLNVNYVAQSPGIQKGFKVPQAPRSDTNPLYNGQPWYKGRDFASVDPTQQTLALIAPPITGKR